MVLLANDLGAQRRASRLVFGIDFLHRRQHLQFSQLALGVDIDCLRSWQWAAQADVVRILHGLYHQVRKGPNSPFQCRHPLGKADQMNNRNGTGISVWNVTAEEMFTFKHIRDGWLAAQLNI